MTSPICLEHVSKMFGRRPAVTELSLTVPAGSIYGLLGHNGAGKSTTLGMLLGQVFPDRGSIRIHGRDVFSDRQGALARVGAIFETPSFYDYLSGLHNLQILCAYSGWVPQSRLLRVVEQVGLTDRVRDKVATYSHGMRQRLALAQALLPGPSTLILDEPTDGLDPEGIAEFRAVIRRLNQEEGMTILFSSHLLSEVELLCDRVAVLHHGRRVFEGDWLNGAPRTQGLDLEVDRRPEAVAGLAQAGLIVESTGLRGRVLLAPGIEPAEVNCWLVARGYAVSRLGLSRLSLEDFYLLTVSDATDEAARAEVATA